MARPIKNNADYFPHDTDMRNDPKIKALRRKFGVEGYGIYCMAIEYIGDSEYFIADFDKLGVELMAGDFDIDPERLIEIIKYCQSLDLLQLESGELSCNSLENRLNPLLSKRERDRSRVFDSDNTHSKVKESKGKKSIEEESKAEESTLLTFDDIFLKAFDDQTCESYKLAFRGMDLGAELQKFRIKCDNDKSKYYGRDVGGLRTAFQYQLQNIRNNGKRKSGTIKDGEDEIREILSREFGAKGTAG